MKRWTPVTLSDELYGKQVVAMWGGGEQEYVRGKVVGYRTEPTILIQLENGERIHWSQSLTRLVE